MRAALIPVLAMLTACGCSSTTPKPAEPAIPLTEYPVPLIMSDGSIEEIIVEDSRPEQGVRMIFCRDMPAQIVCLASINGRGEWLSVPKAATGNQAT